MAKPAKHNLAPIFTDADLFEQLTDKKGPTLWLGRYTEDDVLHLLEKYGFLPALRKKGFEDLIVVTEPIEPYVQAVKIFFDEKSADNVLAEFRLREAMFPHENNCIKTPLRMLVIEWLLLQNPRAKFSPQRPCMPGQRHPGLGLGKKTVHLLVQLAQELNCDGVLNYPEFYNNAYLYLEHFRYWNPRLKGIVLALQRDLAELSLAKLSWAVYLGCVLDANTGQTYEWQADALILPLDEKLKKYFDSEEYEQNVYLTLAEVKFALNREKFEKASLDC
jgi:hypothetical protein